MKIFQLFNRIFGKRLDKFRGMSRDVGISNRETGTEEMAEQREIQRQRKAKMKPTF